MKSALQAWRRVVIGPEAMQHYSALQRQFEEIFVARGGPLDAAVFVPQTPTPGRTLLFTPAAARIAPSFLAALCATPCDPPSVGSVTLIFGHDDALERFERGEFV